MERLHQAQGTTCTNYPMEFFHGDKILTKLGNQIRGEITDLRTKKLTLKKLKTNSKIESLLYCTRYVFSLNVWRLRRESTSTFAIIKKIGTLQMPTNFGSK